MTMAETSTITFSAECPNGHRESFIYAKKELQETLSTNHLKLRCHTCNHEWMADSDLIDDIINKLDE